MADIELIQISAFLASHPRISPFFSLPDSESNFEIVTQLANTRKGPSLHL